MDSLQRLRSDHAAPVLVFETVNRAYFAASISDRGDDFFAQFPARFSEQLAEQAAGQSIFHVLVDQDGAVVGRFNLYDLDGDSAVVGYRVAERAAGRGLATAALRELCHLASRQYGIGLLKAVTSDGNVASRRVLEKAGFVAVGPAHVAGKPGTAFEFVTGEPAGREIAR
jgi:RimJ/RimL family protein N-acetyltransferase